jgi:predicted RNA methylase
MAGNPFDQFDSLPKAEANPFDAFDKPPEPDPGYLGDLARGVKHGLAVTAPRMVGETAQFIGRDIGMDSLVSLGDRITKWAQGNEKPGNLESQAGKNDTGMFGDPNFSVRGNMYEAGDNSVMSVAPGLAGAAAGAGIGSVIAPGPGTALGALLGYLGGNIAALPFFYGSQGEQTYQKVREAQLKQGATPEQADAEGMTAGRKSGGVESFGELVSDVIPLGPLAKPFAKPATKIGGNLVKDIFMPGWKEAGKTLLKVEGGEVATEMGQQALEAEVEQQHGAGEGATWADTNSVVMPTALMSLIPGMASAGAHHVKVRADAAALADPATDPETRAKIALGAAAVLDQVNPRTARAWTQYAVDRIQKGEGIDISGDELYHGYHPEPVNPVAKVMQATTIDETVAAAQQAVDAPLEQPTLPPAPVAEVQPIGDQTATIEPPVIPNATETAPIAPIPNATGEAPIAPLDATQTLPEGSPAATAGMLASEPPAPVPAASSGLLNEPAPQPAPSAPIPAQAPPAAPIAAQAPTPAPPAPQAAPTSFKGGWRDIGKNANGETVQEDPRGVRSIVSNGVRMTESVRMNPGGAISVSHETGRYAVVPEQPQSAQPDIARLDKVRDIVGRTGNGRAGSAIDHAYTAITAGDFDTAKLHLEEAEEALYQQHPAIADTIGDIIQKGWAGAQTTAASPAADQTGHPKGSSEGQPPQSAAKAGFGGHEPGSDAHRVAVGDALAEGKPVPEADLAHYPKLAELEHVRNVLKKPTPQELSAHGLGEEDEADTALVDRARELNAPEVDALLAEHKEDYPAFLKAVKEIVDAHEGREGERSGEGHEAPAGTNAQGETGGEAEQPAAPGPAGVQHEEGGTPGEAQPVGEPALPLLTEDQAAEAFGPFHHLFDAPAKSKVTRLADKVKVYNAKHGWMTLEEAKARIAEWEDEAVRQGKTSVNGDKVVLSLFDRTGVWSLPWEQAGYDVYRFDLQDPEQGGYIKDVMEFNAEYFADEFGDFDGKDIHAILAACPCTDFAASGAKHFAAKDADGRTKASIHLVEQTLAVIEHFRPAIWAIENPVGRIEKLTGLPPWRLSFDPYHFGDPYTKKTLLWGRFNADLPVAPVEPTEGSKMHSQFGGASLATKNARSETPEGFAYAFFMANNAKMNLADALSNKYDRLDPDVIAAAVRAGVPEEAIADAVDDLYYMDQDDEAANDAIRALVGDKKLKYRPPVQEVAEEQPEEDDSGHEHPHSEQPVRGPDGGSAEGTRPDVGGPAGSNAGAVAGGNLGGGLAQGSANGGEGGSAHPAGNELHPGAGPGERAAGEQPASGNARGPRDGGAPTQVPTNTATGNFEVAGELDRASFAPKSLFRSNVAAIRLLKQLQDQRRDATPEEQSVLAGYIGWGGLKQAFDPRNKDWAREYAELKDLLTPAEHEAAARSVLDAHYTSRTVADALWSAVQRLGFDRGKVLEPSMGTGNFFGVMPAPLRPQTKLTGVEYDHITGGIAKLLYPKANIHAPMGFHDLKLSSDQFDLAIGNPPFGDQSLYDKAHKDLKAFKIHAFFFAKALDKVRPGGLVSMVVSKGLLDAQDSQAVAARNYLADRAELVGAIRLPNNAFKANAGTEVTTDLVFLRKLAHGEKADRGWVNLGKVNDVPVNSYFEAHPDMMLGTMGMTGTMYGPNQPTLEPRPGQNLAEDLAEAVAKLPEKVMRDAVQVTLDMQKAKQQKLADTAGELRPYNYFLQDGKLYLKLPDVEGESVQPHPMAIEGAALKRIEGLIEVREAARALITAEASEETTDAKLHTLRAKLNKAYDAFVKKHGYLSQDVNKRAFKDDADSMLLLALEKNFDKGMSADMAKKLGVARREPAADKADIFKKRTINPVRVITSAKSAKDAMLASLNERGKVDPEYMAGLYKKDPAEILKELGELVYEDPDEGYVTSDAYLSGDVKTKLARAEVEVGARSHLRAQRGGASQGHPAGQEGGRYFREPGLHVDPGVGLRGLRQGVDRGDHVRRVLAGGGQVRRAQHPQRQRLPQQDEVRHEADARLGHHRGPAHQQAADRL